jgi:hypothetical protein
MAARVSRLHDASMHTISPPRPTHPEFLASRTLLGAGLVATGLGVAVMAVSTPFVSRLVPVGAAAPNQPVIPLLVSAFALIAGAAMLVAGTNWLAATVASVRMRVGRDSSFARAIGERVPEAVVVSGIVPGEGRPIPELVIGPFGVVVTEELDPRAAIRGVGHSWEARGADGWASAEHPLDRVARDAERTRHWLTHGDLDFVVRVYAVLVAPEGSIQRSAQCAVVSADQVPDWINSLPRQRSLTASRQARLVARARQAAIVGGKRRDW